MPTDQPDADAETDKVDAGDNPDHKDVDAGADKAPDTSATDDSGEASNPEADKWKALARKHEKAAKAMSAKLADAEKAAMSDAEKAVANARDEGRSEARREVGAKLAQARIEAALAKIVDNPSEIAEDLNLAAYVTDDGEVDVDKVAALKAKWVGLLQPGRPTGDADGGPRGDTKPGQLSREDIKSMTPQQITKAKADGRLNDLLGIR